MENKTIRCHICQKIIQIGEIKKEVITNINKIKAVELVLLALVFIVLPFFAIRNTIKYPLESGWYIFTEAGREAHRAEVRRMESVSAYNKRIDRKRTPEEREYQEWKKQEDEYLLQRQKEEGFRKRYGRIR